MSDRKAARTGDPLARLAAIEAPEYLDQLVLDRARLLLAEHANRPRAKARPRAKPVTPIAAWFGRLAPSGIKSS